MYRQMSQQKSALEMELWINLALEWLDIADSAQMLLQLVHPSRPFQPKVHLVPEMEMLQVLSI